MFATEGAGSTQSEAEGVGGVLRVGRFTCTKHLQDSFAVGSWLSIRLHFFFHEESALWTLTDFQWLLMVDCSLEISWEGAPGAQHCWALPGAAQSPEPCERPGEGQGASGPGQLTAMCIWGRSKQMIWVGGWAVAGRELLHTWGHSAEGLGGDHFLAAKHCTIHASNYVAHSCQRFL